MSTTLDDTTPEHISTIDDLREHLQAALELEHATIPPYLCGLYSIKPGKNIEAAEIIRSVVVQEMLHMVLVGNVLNAVGGAPSIAFRDFVSTYPAQLPIGKPAVASGAGGPLIVNLRKFSEAAIDTFLDIERPAEPRAIEADFLAAPPPVHVPPGQLRKMILEGQIYASIGDFYAAIQDGMTVLERRAASKHSTIFTGDPARQVGPGDVGGLGGTVLTVTDVASATSALNEIVEQGEGRDGGIDDVDAQIFAGPRSEVAHYYRFLEIKRGRFFGPNDTPATGPRGSTFTVDYSGDAVFDMLDNPSVSKFPSGEVGTNARKFSLTFTQLLRDLERALNGDPAALNPAISTMFALKKAAIALLNNPAPGHAPHTAGPCFQFAAASADGEDAPT